MYRRALVTAVRASLARATTAVPVPALVPRALAASPVRAIEQSIIIVAAVAASTAAEWRSDPAVSHRHCAVAATLVPRAAARGAATAASMPWQVGTSSWGERAILSTVAISSCAFRSL